MARKPKKPAADVKKPTSHGLWIAPDLERRIKGEQGRRGLGDAPYSYYLHLADVALRSALPTTPPPRPPKVALPKTQVPKPPKLTAAKPPKGPKRPKLSLPRPPKRSR